MANTSATGGFLSPTNTTTAPLEGDALFDFFQAWIVGITGLAGQEVRPRWQPEPANIPLDGTDWVAFGIPRRESQVYAAEIHYDNVNGGGNEVRNHEVLHILLSFYGPNSDNYCSLMREGISLAQNREYLSAASMGLVTWGDAVAAPELIKEKWVKRVDLELSVRRQIIRDYAVLNLQSAQIVLDTEVSQTTINV